METNPKLPGHIPVDAAALGREVDAQIERLSRALAESIDESATEEELAMRMSAQFVALMAMARLSVGGFTTAAVENIVEIADEEVRRLERSKPLPQFKGWMDSPKRFTAGGRA